MKRKDLENKLKYRFFIVGGGAWQGVWENNDKAEMGFNPTSSRESYEPDEKDLKSSIRSELLQRFRNKVLIMKPMTKDDYQLLIPQFAACLPKMRQGQFISLAEKGIDMAVQEQLGMRYFEEILTQTLCRTPEIQPPNIKN